jgi:hypothetical protein
MQINLTQHARNVLAAAASVVLALAALALAALALAVPAVLMLRGATTLAAWARRCGWQCGWE